MNDMKMEDKLANLEWEIMSLKIQLSEARHSCEFAQKTINNLLDALGEVPRRMDIYAEGRRV